MDTTVSLNSLQAAIARAIRLDSSAYTRIEKAAVLIALGAVTRVSELEYTVLSQTRGNGRYVVTPSGCTCIDSERHPGQRCKHSWSVRILLSAQKAEQKAREAALAEQEAKSAALLEQFAPLTDQELGKLTAFKRWYNATSTAIEV